MKYFLFFALFSAVTLSRVAHDQVYHSNQATSQSDPRVKSVSNFLERCKKQTTELNCLQMVFNDDYFWDR